MRHVRCGRLVTMGLLTAVMFAGAVAVVSEQTPAPYVRVFVDGPRGGTAVPANTLHAGDVVTLRINPQTNEIWEVTIQ